MRKKEKGERICPLWKTTQRRGMPRNPAVAGIASAVPVLADARRTHADARKATASAVAASPRTAGNQQTPRLLNGWARRFRCKHIL